MNLTRQAALVAGLLIGVIYTVSDHVESRRPLLAAPDSGEASGVAEKDCKAAAEAHRLNLDSDCFTTQDRASLCKVLATEQA